MSQRSAWNRTLGRLAVVLALGSTIALLRDRRPAASPEANRAADAPLPAQRVAAEAAPESLPASSAAETPAAVAASRPTGRSTPSMPEELRNRGAFEMREVASRERREAPALADGAGARLVRERLLVSKGGALSLHWVERFRIEADGSQTRLSEEVWSAQTALAVLGPDVTPERFGAALAAQGASLGAVVCAMPDGSSIVRVDTDELSFDGVEKLLAAAEATGLCEGADRNYMSFGTRWPNDVNLMESTSRRWHWTRIDAASAWNVRTDSSSILVSVIDTGVEIEAEDLAANIWVNEDEIPGNGIDDDGNGVVDDVHGAGLYNGEITGDWTEDCSGHGTHVAGLIGAVGNNGVGTAGAAWRATIVPIRASHKIVLSDGSTSFGMTDADVINAWQYSLVAGAKVLNCSFAGTSSSWVREWSLQRFVTSQNVILVAACGNDGVDIDASPRYPASYTSAKILSVGALSRSDTLASFSNYGATSVDLVAPGEAVFSTHFSGYANMNGTSMTAPIVAGAAALVWAQNPSASATEIIAHLCNTGEALDALTGKVASGKLLDLGAAMAAFVPTLTLSATQGTETNQVTVSWSAVTGGTASYLQVGRGPSSLREDLEPCSDWLSGSSWTDTAVTPGQLYYYAVRTATDAAGGDASEWSGLVPGYAATDALLDAYDPEDDVEEGAVALTADNARGPVHTLSDADASDWAVFEGRAGCSYVLSSDDAQNVSVRVYRRQSSGLIAAASSFNPGFNVRFGSTTNTAYYVQLSRTLTDAPASYSLRLHEDLYQVHGLLRGYSDRVPVTAHVRLHYADAEEGDLVTAYVGATVRGYGRVEPGSGAANCRFTLNLDEAETEQIVTFRLYDMFGASGTKEYIAAEQVVVSPGDVLGTETRPIVLSYPCEDLSTTLFWVR